MLRLNPFTLVFRLAKRLKSPVPFLRHYLGGLYHRIDDDHVFLSAAGLAFSLFVCTVPFVLIVFAVLVNLLEAIPSDSLQQEIDAYIDRFIPYEQYAAFAKEIISSRLNGFVSELGQYKKLAVYLGAVGLLFAASSLFSSMRTVLNRVYRVDTGKHVVIAKLRDFGMILLVLAFFLVSTTSLPLLEIIKDSAHRIRFLAFFRLSSVENISFSVVSFLLVFVVFFTLYYLIPYDKLSKKVTAVSALFATVLWELAKQAFGYYITNFASLKRVYGPYVLLVVVVFWIYYSSISFIIGAEIGQLYRERRRQRKMSTDE